MLGLQLELLYRPLGARNLKLISLHDGKGFPLAQDYNQGPAGLTLSETPEGDEDEGQTVRRGT